MEHVTVCMPVRDNSPSPHPTENSVVPLVQGDPALLTPNGSEFDTKDPAWPSPSPSTTNSQYTDKFRLLGFELPRSQPLFRGFERPNISRIATLTVLCLITYPAFYLLTLVAEDKPLFTVRLIVSVWCSGFGFALGYFLLRIAARHLEAATWATMIHMSYEGGGMKLGDLARSSHNPTSFMPAFRVFLSRFGNRETAWRSRNSYDKRPWSLFLGFFVVLAILGTLLPFLFGRIVRIETFVRNQSNVYREVLVAGDLSKEDIGRAFEQLREYEKFGRIWSLLQYGRSTSDTTEFVYGNHTVYFAQPSQPQLVRGGSGAWTSNLSTPIGPENSPDNALGLMGRNAPKRNTGAVLRYPQWGIRIHCRKLPDPGVNLIPLSTGNNTYVYVPRDFIREPTIPFGNETIPSNIDLSTIAYTMMRGDNGEGLSLDFLNAQPDDQEMTIFETVLIRLDTFYTPSGRFPVYSRRSSRGYDAAVCVQKYEPWIIETYNTSLTSPSALRIVEKGDRGNSTLQNGSLRGPPVANTGFSNITGQSTVFRVAHSNSVNQMAKDTGGDRFFRPSPIAISFTEGAGLWGYTELSPDRLAVALARLGAANALPYLVGSGPILARSYRDETQAYATFKRWQLISLPILVLVLGIIGELFVPTLPLNIPRREFGVYSWLALFQSQELQFEAADDLDKLMSLEELEDKFSKKRVKFVV